MAGLPFTQLPASKSNLELQGSRPRPMTPGQAATPIAQASPFDPVSIVEDEVAFAQQQINRQFDQAKFQLDQQTYKNPKDYIQAINQLKQQAAEAGAKIRREAEARYFSMQQITGLIKNGTLPVTAGKRALLNIAGLDDETIDAMIPEEKPRNLIQEHATIVTEQNRLSDILYGWKPVKEKLLPVDSEGNIKKGEQEATPAQTEKYLMAQRLYDFYRDKELEIFEQMSPGLRTSIAGQRTAMQRAAAIKKPSWISGLSPLTAYLSVHKMKQQAKSLSEVKVLYAKNPETGERIMSTDGGKSWQQVQ